MNLKIVLPPHNENGLDLELLKGVSEDYFVRYLKKHRPDNIDSDAPRIRSHELTNGTFNGKVVKVLPITGDD